MRSNKHGFVSGNLRAEKGLNCEKPDRGSRFVCRVLWLLFVVVFAVITTTWLSWAFITQVIDGASFAVFQLTVIFLHCVSLFCIKWNRRNFVIVSLSSGLLALIISNLWTQSIFFVNGEYQNLGLAGLWIGVGIVLLVNSVLFISTNIFNYIRFIRIKAAE